MKCTNLGPINRLDQKFGTVFVSTVDVTTGMLWWKKTKTRMIMRKEGDYWFFVDSGRFTPEWQVENLVRAAVAAQALSTTQEAPTK